MMIKYNIVIENYLGNYELMIFHLNQNIDKYIIVININKLEINTFNTIIKLV